MGIYEEGWCTWCEDGLLEYVCNPCSGTGEGQYGDSTCPNCKGTGIDPEYCSCKKGDKRRSEEENR